jgi:imidazolonepropionase-like amidohydrolase
MRPDFMELLTNDSVCDGPYDCRRATRNAIKYGADLIKITSTGGVLTDRATGTGQQMEMDVLVTATVNAADLLGMSESIGTIEAGKYADIIAVDGSPLEDIAELLDVDFVMKDGKIYKQ